ncbi:hypothetical protein [Thalassotalea euphylliae]|uniref:Uncharacterized protein n=1 Tax=Thalassotalea euphylliae TaxID=1655234 RepID=A0A3E0UJR8_9GAMM|nr:hypothetical protein [Thalassotalea euphylliae]REL37191.1 hypothetical protein DXX92_18770 [Thalassotalea euphylliae]
MKKITLMLSLVFISLTASANPSHSLKAQLLTCQSEADSLKRLVCYDGVAKSLSSELPAKQPAVNADKVPATASENVLAAAPAKKSPKIVQVDAEDIFGQEAKFKSSQVDEVRFVIKSATLSKRKKWRFVFENGQKWEQKDTDRFAKFVAGQEVIIKRGVMNAFYLKKPDANRTIRVKRIK